MKKTKTITILLLAALSLAALVGATIYRTTEAASPTTVLGHGIGGGIGLVGYDNEDLAEALGIPVDELNAAYHTASETAVNQALAEGLITQDQADRLLERGAAFSFHRRGGLIGEIDIDYETLLADALGISVEDLQEAYQQIHQIRIDEAVADGRLTEEEADFIRGQEALSSNETFRSSMQAAFESAVQQAVADGVITQSQADQITSRSQTGPGFLNFHGGMRGLGRPGGMERGLFEGPVFSTPSTDDSNGL